MTLGSLVQLPVGGDRSQERILGIEGAGWGREWFCDWPGLACISPPPRSLRVSQDTGSLRADLQGPSKALSYVKGSPSPIQSSAPHHPPERAELGYRFLVCRLGKRGWPLKPRRPSTRYQTPLTMAPPDRGARAPGNRGAELLHPTCPAPGTNRAEPCTVTETCTSLLKQGRWSKILGILGGLPLGGTQG